MNEHWTIENIPNLTGKIAIVTGANSGIGYETAKNLAEKGATVVLACRNLEKAQAAQNEIMQTAKNARLEIMELDLASLASVRKFAEAFKAKYATLDLLINNAGVMTPPFTKTTEGFEVQFGANHLGHFALTGLLLDCLLATPKARIVNVSSGMHHTGTIDFANLNAEKGYNPSGAYAQSKLANLLFTLELNRRLASIGADVIATAAHPGWTVTGLQKGFMHTVSGLLGQKPEMGALPTLQAAVDPGAQPNDYFGPDSFMEMRGYPKKVKSSDSARDIELAGRLWTVSEELTNIHYTWPVVAQQ